MILKTKGQKDWCFRFSLLSIFGLLVGFDAELSSIHSVMGNTFLEDLPIVGILHHWFIFSIPLVVQLLYLKIYGGDSKMISPKTVGPSGEKR